ncbi:MAG TPA: type 1 glutamine amidotransferase [Solirubrobacteraceae bacterium]|nr:type 1 glutamine amidotransferase [Solirubrobacteraceae bacterium]
MPQRGLEAPILVFQHIDCEPPAAYEDELLERGIALRRVRPDAGEELPDWRGHRAIVAMGGPMGVYEDALHPWLADERRLIGEAVRAGTPFWGVCLGAQLLAAVLDARVAPGAIPEVGVLPVELTAAAAGDPVFAAAPESFPSFHWHGDTYELPTGAVQLARSARYEQQAFVFGRAYALQFHLEVSGSLVAEWARVPAYAESLRRLPADEGPPALIERASVAESRTIPLARELFARWLVHVVGL